jgi:hypothetical protein
MIRKLRIFALLTIAVASMFAIAISPEVALSMV